MNAELKGIIEDEVEQADRLIIAAENWGPEYAKDPDTHAQLIKLEARLTRLVRSYLREQGDKVVNYMKYSQVVTADYQLQVEVTGDFYDGFDSDFMSVVFDTIALEYATGAAAGENIYAINLGIRSIDAEIQRLTAQRVAWLVGKKLDKDGNVVDNPKAAYRVSDKVRADIQAAVKTSIALGEDRATTADRIRSAVINPKRAEIIAQTETVNAYGNGLLEFGRQSGATGKESQDVSATDVCAEYAHMGVVPLDYLYGDRDLCPAYHTGCRCGLRLAYSNEYDPEKALTR